MQAKATQTALSKQQCHGPSSDFSSLSTAGREALPVHLHNIALGASITILADEMPVVEPLPHYKAWDYLVSNELAQGVGRQMYYTDEIGIYSCEITCQSLRASHNRFCLFLPINAFAALPPH